ncbi:MAG: hypothetical protein ACR2MX_06945, partial [Cyclobacteriaceae bacterium]
MNHYYKSLIPGIVGLLLFSGFNTLAQDGLTIKASPETIRIPVDGTAQIKAMVVDADGKPQPDKQVFYYSRKRSAVGVDSLGMVTGIKPGAYDLILVSPDGNGKYIRLDYSVEVIYP